MLRSSHLLAFSGLVQPFPGPKQQGQLKDPDEGLDKPPKNVTAVATHQDSGKLVKDFKRSSDPWMNKPVP
jgi:hypothetical protein